MAYNKLTRSPPITATIGSIKSVKSNLNKDRKIRGHFMRKAPSVESSKEIPFNKLRNKTLARVVIGGNL